MDEKSIKTLELPAVLAALGKYAGFSASKSLALTLRPASNPEAARTRLEETSEGVLLLYVTPDLTIGGAHDVRSEVDAATRGATLEPSQMLDIKDTLLVAKRFFKLFVDDDDKFPLLSGIAESLTLHPELVDAITSTFDDRGEVLDSASTHLAKIRRELRVSREKLMHKLQKMVGDPKIIPMLQEPIITQRDGRYVIPLRSEFKGKVKSIIQDQSASGATLFVEPLQVVEHNNQIRELELAERDEIQKILRDLSENIGHCADSLIGTVEGLAEIDLALAKARYAQEMDAIQPVLHSPKAGSTDPPTKMRLFQARHPLLNPQKAVPIDLVLDEDTCALVITGPNTGGKTVSLKTAGLLSLMAACGLHIPVGDASEVSFFDAVYADIGDEQSIEQSLSTFSSHISNIIRILGRAERTSLVLLDELGAGTDPQEGSALGQALLGEFLRRGVMTIVATHISALKAYAHLTPGIHNASVEFDLDSLRPTYRLLIGLPGRSNALAIAQRLGMDASIVEEARTLVSEDDLETDSLLDDIYQQRDQVRLTKEETEQARTRVREREDELNRRLQEIDRERHDVLLHAREEADKELEDIKEGVRRLRRKLSLTGQSLEAVDTVEHEIEILEDEREDTPLPKRTLQNSPASSVALGDRVFIKSIDNYGVVTRLSENQAEVQVGRLRVRARLDELAMDSETGEITSGLKDATAKFKAPTLHESPPLELDLRGMAADEAIDMLDRRLDAAYLVGMPYIRIVHGKGTGILRTAIREALRDNDYIASFEPGKRGEGGDGVTVARIKIA
jgi:DNA mismatch repair protein MutS2